MRLHWLLASVLLTGCPIPGINAAKTLTLGAENLAELRPERGQYALWLRYHDRSVISLGTFTSRGGAVNPTRFTIDKDPAGIKDAFVTIEAPGDTDASPSAAVLSGKWDGRKAALSLLATGAFSSASGSFVLDNPWTLDNTDYNGIWFSDISQRFSGFSGLPELPDEWVYSAWVLHGATVLRVGDFRFASEADNFHGYTGGDLQIEKPGEDFNVNLPDGLTPASVNLSGKEVLVTIEPATGSTVPGPFVLFRGVIPSPAFRGASSVMSNRASSFPTLSLQID